MLTRRLAVPLAAIALLGVSLAPASGEAPTGADRLCDGGSDAVLKKERWTLFAKPKELERIVAHAEEPDAGALFVADSNRVMRSTDGGCSWNQVYEVADADRPGHARRRPGPSHLAPDGRARDRDRSARARRRRPRAAASQVLRSDEGGDEGSWKAVEGIVPGDRRARDRGAGRLR